MKNMVMVRHLRARPEMALPNAGMLSRTKVFSSMAITKKRMNQGMVIFLSLLLNMNDVARASGMIQRALVSLIVVATCSASSPYAAPAPIT